jgi:hypothetical protein
MKHEQIVKQSVACYNQWATVWRKNAAEHAAFKHNSFEDFRNIGIGRAVLCVANGYSFEENIEVIKANARNVDIMACDKTLGHLLKHGIKPKYCVVCDANVNYEKYLKPYEDQLDKTILIQNVCGNPEWSKNGNWQAKYFYVNKDVMGYEKEFMKISGCKNAVTAGTNVSNMMIVLLTQCDNEKRQNLFGYDKILLIGYDYSWKPDGKYYAFDEDGGGKKFYMRHVHGIAPSGKYIYTSNNLSSSASWLNLYISAYKVPVVQCSPDTIMPFGRTGKLEDHMKYEHKPSDRGRVKNLLIQKLSLETELNRINNNLKNIATDHWFSSRRV